MWYILNASEVRLVRDSIVQQTSLKEYIKQDGLRDHSYIYVTDPSSVSAMARFLMKNDLTGFFGIFVIYFRKGTLIYLGPKIQKVCY